MKRTFSKITALIILMGLLAAHSVAANTNKRKPITTAAERTSEYFPLLEGKRIALVVNKTSTIGKTHLVDTLLASGFDVSLIFAPEHGFRGDKGAGEKITDGKDPKTGISIISLYGKNRKPAEAHLQGIDIVIFDIQDVGVRFYTYISTMHYAMEACAENGLTFMVLDRPNPNGDYVGGPVLETAMSSFVGMHPIPIVHGLTVGELALMINNEKWLKNGVKCKLIVVKNKNWSHSSKYELPIAPSPNLPNYKAIRLYPSLCLFEATAVSIGRGTEFPFQTIGFPDDSFGNFSFAPVSMQGAAPNPKHKDLICYGQDLRVLNAIPKFTLDYLIRYRKRFIYFDNFMTRTSFFNLLAGNKELAYQIEQGLSEETISASWEPELSNYKTLRKKYLLYPDFDNEK